jgi:hypothetical protein
MRRYADADEEAVRTATRVRDWKASGLLDAARASVIENELRTGLRRTHWALRGVLFVFSMFVIQSAVGLVFVVGMPDEEAVAAILALIAGAGCFWIADFLVAKYHLYRFGVEEACALCAIGLVTGGVTLLASAAGLREDGLVIVALMTASLVAGVVYVRLGLLYSAIVAMVAVTAVSFFVGLAEMSTRLLAAALLLSIHVVARQLRRRFGDDYPGDDYGVIESAAWLGVYVLINLQLTSPFMGSSSAYPRFFYWVTYAAIWILPVAGLYMGVQEKHRWMIRASLLMLLLTLVTNKSYLGWERHSWDPILLGVVLVAAALVVRRWLAGGTEGHRHGFIPSRLLSSDEHTMAQLAFVAAALKPDEAVRERRVAEEFQTGGGRSGGAGASGRF